MLPSYNHPLRQSVGANFACLSAMERTVVGNSADLDCRRRRYGSRGDRKSREVAWIANQHVRIRRSISAVVGVVEYAMPGFGYANAEHEQRRSAEPFASTRVRHPDHLHNSLSRRDAEESSAAGRSRRLLIQAF